jgi:hypothetical protein
MRFGYAVDDSQYFVRARIDDVRIASGVIGLEDSDHRIGLS